MLHVSSYHPEDVDDWKWNATSTVVKIFNLLNNQLSANSVHGSLLQVWFSFFSFNFLNVCFDFQINELLNKLMRHETLILDSDWLKVVMKKFYQFVTLYK